MLVKTSERFVATCSLETLQSSVAAELHCCVVGPLLKSPSPLMKRPPLSLSLV